MFRKNPQACDEWSLDNVVMCAARQMDILEDAQKMLAPGGILVYSTCTFSPEENEQVIEKFLKKYSDFELVESPMIHPAFNRGTIQWTNNQEAHINRTIRLWPHKLKGEGHFIAIMKKANKADIDKHEFVPTAKSLFAEKIKKLIPTKEDIKYYLEFCEQHLNIVPSENLINWTAAVYPSFC